ncbi:hypothetical protein [Sphingobium sp. LMC3-1-1.1]|uniref:hypothetical protein n=2 Tax=Sphingobium TaxID=165695 RepID=UPI0034413086
MTMRVDSGLADFHMWHRNSCLLSWLLNVVSVGFMRIEATEYECMRSWLGHMVPKVFAAELLNPEIHPIAVLDLMAAKSPAKARSGLGMAIGDMVEYTDDWAAPDVAKCNSELSEKGLPTLTEVRARFSKVVQRVVRRGRIKTDDEFYALRNAVEQQGINAEILWPLLEAYEIQSMSN